MDDESLLEFETTRVTTHKGLIVGYRAPVLRDGKRGVEEKCRYCANARIVNLEFDEAT